jgi:hypothetical protein
LHLIGRPTPLDHQESLIRFIDNGQRKRLGKEFRRGERRMTLDEQFDRQRADLCAVGVLKMKRKRIFSQCGLIRRGPPKHSVLETEPRGQRPFDLPDVRGVSSFGFPVGSVRFAQSGREKLWRNKP